MIRSAPREHDLVHSCYFAFDVAHVGADDSECRKGIMSIHDY